MATQRESQGNPSTGTANALQRLEGFANRLFHRQSKGSVSELKVTAENGSSDMSELTALWEKSSKCV